MSENSVLSALISLQDRQLLVPDNLLADVTPFGGMIVESHKERWVLGHKYWRNMRIPVKSATQSTANRPPGPGQSGHPKGVARRRESEVSQFCFILSIFHFSKSPRCCYCVT